MAHGIACISGSEMAHYCYGRSQSHPPTNYQHFLKLFVCEEKQAKELDFGLRRNHQNTMDIQPIDGNKFPLCILLPFQIHPDRLPSDSSRRGAMKANANIPNRNGFLPQRDILIGLCVVACRIEVVEQVDKDLLSLG